MKLNHLFFTLGLSFVGAIGYGQTVPSDTMPTDSTDSMQTTVIDSVQASSSAVDSAAMLKLQEKTGKISGQLARNRDKLAHLEKEYQEKTAAKEKAVQSAEASAQANRAAANELSDDATNRSKARKAEKSASRARRDTKSLQRADKNLQRLEKDINKVKKQIADDEKALSDLQQQQYRLPLIPQIVWKPSIEGFLF